MTFRAALVRSGVRRTLAGATLVVGLTVGALLAQAQEAGSLPELVREDFEKGADRWTLTDASAWKVAEGPKGRHFSHHKASKYAPPHRSPLNIALLKDVTVGDFVLEAKVQSTVKDYGHRDMCLFFGYQSPAEFYYVHLGKKTDDHANQIFIVNKADRKKISTKTSEGTNWTDEWHQLKLVRHAESGKIEVYFDDMKTPVMEAVDKTFTWGQVGIGSFDDLGNWDDVVLRGVKVEKK